MAVNLTMHLVLCPGCGYSFWTAESDFRQRSGHCMKPYDPLASDLDDGTYPWLVDEDAIDFIAMPELYGKT